MIDDLLFFCMAIQASNEFKKQSTPSKGKHRAEIIVFEKYYNLWNPYRRDEILKEVAVIAKRKKENQSIRYLRKYFQQYSFNDSNAPSFETYYKQQIRHLLPILLPISS